MSEARAQTILTSAPAPRLGWLLRGESVVASVGIAVAAILLAVLGACAWWTMGTQSEALARSREAQVQAVAALLARPAEALLAREELATVRRMLADARRDFDLAVCRIVLPDGGVLADGDPSRVGVSALPAEWPVAAAGGAGRPLGPGEVGSTTVLAIGQRGPARLELAGGVGVPPGGVWEMQSGVALIGAAGLGAVLLVYRRMRARLAALGVIQQALRALQQGERTPQALAVSDDLGPEARAWNQLLAENDRLRQLLSADKARQTVGLGRAVQADLDAACDAMPHGVVLLDEKLRVRYANGAAAVFLQRRRADFAGAPIADFVKDARMLAALGQAAGGDSRQRATLVSERGEEAGGGVLRCTIRPLGKQESGGALLILEDITQQRVADASRGNFVAQATHELRTPLTNIRLYLETALNEGESDAAVRAQCLNVMNQESRRLEQIVSEILSLSQIEAGCMKLARDDVRLEQLFADLAGPHQAAAREKGVALSLALPPKLPVIQGDREKIAMALHNLLGNAVKYTPAGGRVEVTVKVESGSLLVQVADTGIGIAEDEQERVFEKFYRGRDPRVAKVIGSGLGLALTREVVRLHGGEVTLQSQLNKGSTFTLLLPLQAEAA